MIKTKKIKCILSILGGLFLILFLGCLIPTKWIVTDKTNATFEIWIEDVGIHTNIIVPVQNEAFDWHEHLGLKESDPSRHRDYRYLSFGWGDRLFYVQTPTPSDFKLGNAIDALLIPGESVMYVQGIYNLSPSVSVKCMKVSRQDYLNLVKYLQSSFNLDPQGKAIFVAEGYDANGSFYEAKGSYSIFRTCNVWTGEALRAADLNTPIWTAFAPAIMWHLQSDCSLDRR